MSGFQLSQDSLDALAGAEPGLRNVVLRAIEITDVDFSVIQTIRSEAQQRINIENGVSWTMDSKHLPNENDEVEAVDIYPWHGGQTDHSPELYDRIAKAMFQAAAEQGYPLTWGGFWWKDDGTTGRDRPHFERL